MKQRTIYLENTSEKEQTGSLDGRCLGNSRWRGQDGSIELSFTDIITIVKLIKVFGFNYQFVVDVKRHIGLNLIKTRKACFLFFNSFHVLVSQIKSTRKRHLHYSAYASYFAACRGIRDTKIPLLVHGMLVRGIRDL